MTEKIRQLENEWDRLIAEATQLAFQGKGGIVYKKPKILVAVYLGQTYITISDHESVFFFVSKLKQVHAAVGFKCHEMKIDGGLTTIYNITEPESLQMVSCSENKAFSPLSEFVNNNLRHIIYG